MSVSEAWILDGVAEVARLHVGFTGELRPELRLVEDLELDSLKSLTLALEVENHFRICLDDDSVIQTVGELVAMIGEKLDA